MNALSGDAAHPIDDEPEDDGEIEEVEVDLVSGSQARRSRATGAGGLDFSGASPSRAQAARAPAPVASLSSSRRRAARKGTGAAPGAATSIWEPDSRLPQVRLRDAWEHLRRNELDEAAALAEGVAGEYPDVAEAKMILARCSINRKEYRRALLILQSIPDRDKNAEALYFLGLCRGRMGDTPRALDALAQSIGASADEAAKKRAGDLMRHLNGGHAPCPECGKMHHYSELVDIGNKTVCPACAGASPTDRNIAKKQPVAAAIRGRLPRFPVRLAAAAVFLCALAYAGLFAFSRTAPEGYGEFRKFFPAAWTFLPPAVPPAEAEPAPPPVVSPPPPQTQPRRVYAAPHFAEIARPSGNPPGGASYLLAASESGKTEEEEIVSVRGRSHDGGITLSRMTADGTVRPVARAVLSGRPAGAGMLDVAGENWIAVADYPNSWLRYFAVRGEDLTETPSGPALPGKPVLAGFDRASGTSFVLCRRDDSMRLAAYRAVDWTHTEKTGEWTVPPGHVWRAVVPLAESAATGHRPAALLVGGDPARSTFLFSPDAGEAQPVPLPFSGTVVDAAAGADGRVRCLLDADGRAQLASFRLGRDKKLRDIRLTTLADPAPRGGLAAVDADTAVLSATGLTLVGADDADADGSAHWELPSPPRLFGPVLSLPSRDGAPGKIIYEDADGALWSAVPSDAQPSDEPPAPAASQHPARVELALTNEREAADIFPGKRWDRETIERMAERIASLPDGAAAELLWRLASAPPEVDAETVFARAAEALSPRVREAARALHTDGADGDGERTKD